jgi:hypothetical protein
VIPFEIERQPRMLQSPVKMYELRYEVRRERLQSNIASMVKDVLRTHITRGEISLDKPRD